MPTTTISQLVEFLERFAPPALAESWDNVGLLAGDRAAAVDRVMTCLTITPASAAEAIDERADLVVVHHPLPFQPLKRLTTDTVEGRLLWRLIGARVAIYSPHTAFDSARDGINRRLVDGLELRDARPIVPHAALGAADALGELGAGRFGRLDKPLSLDEFAERVQRFLNVERLQIVGDWKQPVSQVAVACGSAGEFLGPARRLGCDCLVTGETRFHTSLEAEATGMALVLAGHYATERFGIEALAGVLSGEFPALRVWPSHREHDPLRWR